MADTKIVGGTGLARSCGHKEHHECDCHVDNTSLGGEGTRKDPFEVIAPAGKVIFRPEDPLGSHRNVYVTWAEAYEAFQLFQGLGAEFQFDGTFAQCVVPVGLWLFDRVLFTNKSFDNSDVLLEDGAQITTPDPGITIRIEGAGLRFLSNRVGPVAPFQNVSFQISGNNVRFFNTDPAALPMIVVGDSTQLPEDRFSVMLWDGAERIGGLGEGIFPAETDPFDPHGAMPDAVAPIVDVNGGFFAYYGGGGFIANNACTDLSVAGGGIVGLEILTNAFIGNPFAPFDFPALVANGGAAIIFDQLPRNRYNVFAPINDLTPPYTAQCNELVFVDTTAGVVTVNAPRAVLSPGERFTVKDVGGAAALNNITVLPTGGDTLEAGTGTIALAGQAKTWVSDGVGNWWFIAAT